MDFGEEETWAIMVKWKNEKVKIRKEPKIDKGFVTSS